MRWRQKEKFTVVFGCFPMLPSGSCIDIFHRAPDVRPARDKMMEQSDEVPE
jgi:hypothetical protein